MYGAEPAGALTRLAPPGIAVMVSEDMESAIVLRFVGRLSKKVECTFCQLSK